MKLKVGDMVVVTGGKDKGKKGKILAVSGVKQKVVVENANIYVKHIKPINGQAGQRLERPRALPTANVAILNNENKPDRIGYRVAKDGSKERIYKKTGKVIPEPVKAKKK